MIQISMFLSPSTRSFIQNLYFQQLTLKYLYCFIFQFKYLIQIQFDFSLTFWLVIKVQENQLFFKDIRSTLQPISQLILYKIFGEQNFRFENAKYEQKVDWSGFYTQLTPQHSMRYLTKKWDDGAEMACLLRFSIQNFNLRLLYIEHQTLSSHKVSGQTKAENIKMHMKENYEEFKDIQGKKLLKYLGDHRILMSCIDSQDQQIIIPHSLLNQDFFQFEHIARFKKSNDGMLRTILFQKQSEWRKVPSEVQFQPYLLLNEQIWKEEL